MEVGAVVVQPGVRGELVVHFHACSSGSSYREVLLVRVSNVQLAALKGSAACRLCNKAILLGSAQHIAGCHNAAPIPGLFQ